VGSAVLAIVLRPKHELKNVMQVSGSGYMVGSASTRNEADCKMTLGFFL